MACALVLLHLQGFFYVLKYPQKNPPREPQKHISPLLIMDYRCHAPVSNANDEKRADQPRCSLQQL